MDSACWQRNGVTGVTIAEAINNELYAAKLVTFGKSSKGRLEGANAIKERLIGNQMADGTYKPAIYFFKNCVHCLRTLPMIGHDKRNPELPDTNGEDHLMDAICYGLMSRPYAPTKIKPIIRDGYRREESPSAWSN